MKLNNPITAAFGISFYTLLASMAHADAELSISPPDQSIIVGSTFSVDVNISGAADLYGFQFDVQFNPALIEAISSSEGAFLEKGGFTFFIPGSNDNVGGSVFATADTLISAVPGVTGSGNLAVLTFEALNTGVSSVSISGAELIDSGFNFISSSSTGGSVTVGAPSHMTAPEIDPASAISAMTLLLGGLTIFRRRRAS